MDSETKLDVITSLQMFPTFRNTNRFFPFTIANISGLATLAPVMTAIVFRTIEFGVS